MKDKGRQKKSITFKITRDAEVKKEGYNPTNFIAKVPKKYKEVFVKKEVGKDGIYIRCLNQVTTVN